MKGDLGLGQSSPDLWIMNLKERQRARKERDSIFDQRLKTQKGIHVKIKKLDPKILLEHLTKQLEVIVFRDTTNMKFKSHNLEKQWIEFLSATFCKYQVPFFMLNHFPFHFTWQLETGYNNKIKNPYPKICPDSLHAVDTPNLEIYQDMFKIITMGDSLRKYLRGVLTAKECGIFLTLKNNFNISTNFWVARLKAFGFSNVVCDRLIYNFFVSFNPIFHYLDVVHIMQFFKKYEKDLSNEEMIDICDFLRSRYRANCRITENNFTLKGRTLSSVIALSNEWHQEQLKLKVGKNSVWSRIEMEDRKVEIDDIEYKFVELFTSRDLFEEGKKQKHCVGSYVSQCMDGHSAIFSMRYKDLVGDPHRITIEIRSNQIVQCRGNCNRRIDEFERKAIRTWANGVYLCHNI